MKLEKQAQEAGGRVHCLLGNHEAMDIYGDLRYISPGEYAAFRDENSEKIREMGCLLIEEGKPYALHRGNKLELPKDNRADLLRYLKEAAALDPAPSPLAARIKDTEAKP